MRYRVGLYGLLALTCLCGLLYAAVGAAEAAPPAPLTYTLTQPDGAAFNARSRGDEWHNWIETLDGYSIARNETTRFWEYATLTTREEDIPGQGWVKRQVLTPSGHVVGREPPQSAALHAAPDSVQPFLASPRQREASAPGFAPQPPHKGLHPTLILRVSFTDENFHSSEAEWANAVFGDVGAGTGVPSAGAADPLLTGRVGLGLDKLSVALPSLKRYWLENSYNNIILQPLAETSGTANDGIVQVALNYTHPNTTTFGLALQQTTRDAILAADAAVNFATLDTDNNGDLSTDELHVVIILAGAEAAYGDGCNMHKVWGHKWGVWMVDVPVVDGKTVGHSYMMMGEMDCSGSTPPGHMATIGTIAHELGHDMGSGVPDLYDTNGGSSGIGAWGLQGVGSWNSWDTGLAGTHPAHSSAWEKWLMGLLTPARVTTSALVSLDAVETSTSASHGVVQVLDNPDGVQIGGGGEYFLLENRQLVGYDKGLPGEGLLIWHIDETTNSNADQGTEPPGHRRLVVLVQADGKYDLECFTNDHCNGGDSGDPWRNSVLGLRPTGTPNSALWSGEPSNVTVNAVSLSGLIMTAFVQPPAGPPRRSLSDLDGDGKSDLVWRHGVTGQNVAWLMNGTSATGYPFLPTVADQTWKIVAVGDLNADRKADLVWRNSATGQNVAWLMDGGSLMSFEWLPTVPDAAWKVVGVGDLNADDKADLVWRNSANGQNIVWLMNGGAVTAYPWLQAMTDLNWKVVGVGDLNADGKADLLWRNTASGETRTWLMDGATVAIDATLTTVADPNWKVVGVADLNGDSKADLLWRSTASGQNVAWLMDGAAITSSVWLTAIADQNWKVVSLADLDGNGKNDVVWRNFSTGQNSAWFMDGGTITGAPWLPTVADFDWRVVSPASLTGALLGLLPGFNKAADGQVEKTGPLGGTMWQAPPTGAAPMWTEPPGDARPMWSAPDADAPMVH